MSDADRVHAVVLRYFERMAQTEFPTVQRVQRTLHWTYDRILQAVIDDQERMFTTSYNVHPEPPIGEHYIELY